MTYRLEAERRYGARLASPALHESIQTTLNIKPLPRDRGVARAESNGIDLLAAADTAGWGRRHENQYVVRRSAGDGTEIRLKTCQFCGAATTQLQGCSRCKTAYYCGKEWYANTDSRFSSLNAHSDQSTCTLARAQGSMRLGNSGKVNVSGSHRPPHRTATHSGRPGNDQDQAQAGSPSGPPRNLIQAN